MKHKLEIGGNVRIKIYDLLGNLVQETEARNLFVDTGLNKIRDLICRQTFFTGTKYTPDYIALGTSSAATTSGMTYLLGEVFRGTVTARDDGTSKTLKFYLNVGTGDANGYTLNSVGLYTESTGGTLWSRAVITPIVKTSAVSFQTEWEVTFFAF